MPDTLPPKGTDAPATGPTLNSGFKHPLDPLTPDEIAQVCLSVRHHVATRTAIQAVRFIICCLLPPPKKAVLAYLGIPLSPGAKPETALPIVRKAEVDFLDIVAGHCYNVILSFIDGIWVLELFKKLDASLQPQISVEELVTCEQVVRNDKRVQQLAKEIGVLPDQIFCDGWAIGYDDRFPQNHRVQQALMFARFSEHDNLYAHPLDFVPVVDSNKDEVIHIDFPSQYVRDAKGEAILSVPSTAPPPLQADSFVESKRDRLPPPRRAFNFLPDLMAETEEGFKFREDIKPLLILQPEGVSFKIKGHVLEWQNWKMHVAFHHREGIALSTITYNDHGEIRPILYRLSLAEMVVPYAAPEHPHPRKFAFDSGEYGMGTMANELSLGCDCLGKIHYMQGSFVAHSGSAFVIQNAICIHEEDSGVLWKHSDYRPNGRGQTVRRRRLVVSMVCTLANYEYIFNYHFYQDGSIELEIRLTGILQTYVQKDNEPNPYGTTIAPNISAHYHQHMFSVRLDPMIDGLKNTVIESDILPLTSADMGTANNYAGNAFVSRDNVLTNECGRPYDFGKERRWRIVNPDRRHYASGREVGYTLGIKGGMTAMMQHAESWVSKRATFLHNAVWVCRDEEDPQGRWGTERMWPSGKYVPQTRSPPEDSIGSWVKGKRSIEAEDLIVYLTVGTTHIPRPEDWPVMPVEDLNITLKPVSFFKTNPSMDVPGSSDVFSKAAFDGVNGREVEDPNLDDVNGNFNKMGTHPIAKCH